MSKITKVFMKETGQLEQVKFTDDTKPKIEKSVLEKWQVITNILVQLLNARASLINRLDMDFLEIFTLSQNDKNPYKVGMCDPVGEGAYCEMVVGKKQKLIVTNAKKNPIWQDSMYVDFNFISYFGLPVLWPDGEVFGTICVIDDKENDFSEEFQSIFREFRYSMEKDLEILVKNDALERVAEYDALTNIYNRRKLDLLLESEFLRCKRYDQTFSAIIIDLDSFKQINDRFGHQMGDTILKNFASYISSRIRKIDYWGRLGGDEFLLICPHSNSEQALSLINSLSANLISEMRKLVEDFEFSYGIATYDNDEAFEHILKRADDQLYIMKNKKK